VQDKLSKGFAFESLKVNHLTGSILFSDEKIDLKSISDFAEEEKLFSLQSIPSNLSKKVAAPIGNVSQILHNFTSGQLDLAGVAFLALLAMGLYQIFRGKSKVPPWYTAFWYAFGVFTRMLQNHDKAKGNMPQ
jgi:hypothetical protein